MKIAGYVDERRKSLVIVLNKWDLAKKEVQTRKEVEKAVYHRLNFISYAPVIFVSAKSGQRISQIFENILRAHKQYVRRR